MRGVVSLGMLATLNVLLSFAQYAYILTAIGPGAQTDALVAGAMIPHFIQSVMTNSMMNVLVPILALESGVVLRRTSWTLLVTSTLFFGIMATLLGLTAGGWFHILVPGFDLSAIALSMSLLRVQLVGIAFLGMTIVLWSVLRARGNFVWAETASLVANAAALGGLVHFVPHYGVIAAAWIAVARSAFQVVLMMPLLGHFELGNFSSHSVQTAWKRIRPLLGGAVFYKTTLIIEKSILSHAPASSISILNLAQQVYSAIEQIMNKAFVVPAVPQLARYSKAENWEGFDKTWKSALSWVGGVTTVIFLLTIFPGGLILKQVGNVGNFTSENFHLLWLLLLALFGQVVLSPVSSVLNSTFYSKGNTVLPTLVGIGATIVGIGLRFLGFLWGQTLGVAVAITAQYLIAVLAITSVMNYRRS